jgi:PAS domain S-box-containing protein
MRASETSSLLISSNPQDMGAILQSNAAYSAMFGFTRSELVGQKLAAVMPAPYSTSHPFSLSKYFNAQQLRGDLDLKHRNHHCFVMHKFGHMVHVQVTVRNVVSNSGSSLLGMLTLKNTPYQYAIVDPEHVITSCTRGFAALFQLNALSVLTNGLSVTSLFPDYLDRIDDLKDEEYEFIFLHSLFCIVQSLTSIFVYAVVVC